MALQDTGQITATDIMAEFSYTAASKWAVSADGAGFINFTVGSIIKYSDFYSASASTGSAFTLPLSQGHNNSTNQFVAAGASGSNFIVLPTDALSATTNSSSITGFNSTMTMTLSTGKTFRGGNHAMSIEGQQGPPSNGRRGASTEFSMPFTAQSGKTYELWSNYTATAGWWRGNSLPDAGLDCMLIRVKAGTYDRYWGYAKQSNIQSQVGNNGGINVSTTANTGQVYGNDDYIGRGWTGFSDPREGFAIQGSQGMEQTTGPLHSSIPGSDIIAEGNKVRFIVMLGTWIKFSNQVAGIHFGGASQNRFTSTTASNNVNSQGVQPSQGPVYSTTTFRKMGGYTGTADPNNVDGTYGNSGSKDRHLIEIVETGTY